MFLQPPDASAPVAHLPAGLDPSARANQPALNDGATSENSLRAVVVLLIEETCNHLQPPAARAAPIEDQRLIRDSSDSVP